MLVGPALVGVRTLRPEMISFRRWLPVLALALLAAGCGGSARRSTSTGLPDTASTGVATTPAAGEPSAAETARKLELSDDWTWPYLVHCGSGSAGWDYRCRVTFPGGQDAPQLEWVKVNARGISDLTYARPLPALGRRAAGTTPEGAEVLHLDSPIGLLAPNGSRIAYLEALAAGTGAPPGNALVIWNARTGTTTKLDDVSPDVSELAFSGTRVAWLVREIANTYGRDTLYAESVPRRTSSVPQVKSEVAAVERNGETCGGGASGPCAGRWIGGLLGGGGGRILVNRWTTNRAGRITGSGLYVLLGTQLRPMATGAATVQRPCAQGSFANCGLSSAAADHGRLAVIGPGGSVDLYSSSGRKLLTVNPAPRASAVALSGRNLLVLGHGETLGLYDARTGRLRKSFPIERPSIPCGRSSTNYWCGPSTAQLARNLGLQGDIAIYTDACAAFPGCGAIHALDLTSGKDRVLGTFPGGISQARIDSAGLVYAGNGYYRYKPTYGKGTLVFLPLSRVAAAIS